MARFLVDSSVWVAFFRGDPEAVERMRPLITEDRVAVAGPIYAEVLSGATTRDVQNRFRVVLQAMRWLSEPPQLWDRVAETRFLLARHGYQASLVDVMIALTAAEAGCTVLTRDRDFERIGGILALPVVVF